MLKTAVKPKTNIQRIYIVGSMYVVNVTDSREILGINNLFESINLKAQNYKSNFYNNVLKAFCK